MESTDDYRNSFEEMCTTAPWRVQDGALKMVFHLVVALLAWELLYVLYMPDNHAIKVL